MYTAIIPAYNESARIARVIQVAQAEQRVTEIIVIDDCSTDNTAAIAQQLRVKLICNEQNIGKTRSVQKAVQHTTNKHLLLLDGDLEGFLLTDVSAALDRYEAGMAMVIVDYGGQEKWLRNIVAVLPALSGVRILSKANFQHINFGANRWELETSINKHFLKQHQSIAIVHAPTLRSPYKHEKYPFWQALLMHVSSFSQILLAGGVLKIPLTIYQWYKLRILEYRQTGA